MARAPSRYFVILARGERLRTLSLRPVWFYSLASLAPMIAAASLASTLYFVFHDDVVSGLMQRVSDSQAGYEIQLAALRDEAARKATGFEAERQALDGRIRDLATRQARFESHQSVLNAVAPTGFASSGRPALSAAQSINRLIGAPSPEPSSALSFAPTDGDKPRPERLEIHSDATMPATPARPQRKLELAQLGSGLDTLELAQTRTLASLGAATRADGAKWHAVLTRAGLTPQKIAALNLRGSPGGEAGTGGPFIPIRLDDDSSPFGRELVNLQSDMVESERLHRAISHMPLAKPLSGDPDVTSPFGARVDPFMERMAIHTGVDLRHEYGAPVRSTAPGRVAVAAFNGGYGNMVEIDHGSGIVTRYAHLSVIAVTEGQSVEAGMMIGKIGTTGRSTGPHLHYEVRVDGEPVDPMRWFAAGTLLAQSP